MQKKFRKPQPLVRLVKAIEDVGLDQNKFSERQLTKEIEAMCQDAENLPDLSRDRIPSEFLNGMPSSSHLTRILNGNNGIHFDSGIIYLIGRYFGRRAGIAPPVAAMASLSEYELWQRTLNERVTLTESDDSRPPIVRHKIFREITGAIINDSSLQVVTIGSSGNKVGVSAFSLLVAQYIGYDVQPRVRRTLRIVSLDQLDSEGDNGRKINAKGIAQRIGAQLKFSRRRGVDAIHGMAHYFSYLPKPLLLIKDVGELPQAELAKFIQKLIAALPENCQLVILVAVSNPLFPSEHKDKNEKPKINEFYRGIGYFDAEDFAAYILWKTNTSRQEVASLAALLRKPIKGDSKRPDMAALLAGIYNLRHLNRFRREGALQGKNSPTQWFKLTEMHRDDSRNYEYSAEPTSVTAEMRNILRDFLLEEKVVSDQEIFSLWVNELNSTQHEDGREVSWLMQALCVFHSRFSKAAALALFDPQGKGKRDRDFERILDRLVAGGGIIYERGTKPSTLFRVTGEVREWVQTRTFDTSLPYKQVARDAKRRYFQYIERQIESALAYFADPDAVDPANLDSFSVLSPEANHLDRLLNETWLQLKESPESELAWIPDNFAPPEDGLIPPNFWFKGMEELTLLECQKVRCALLCANVAIFWDVQNYPAVGDRHLRKAHEMMEPLVEMLHQRRRVCENEVTRARLDRCHSELSAIESQLILSRLIMEIRYETTVPETEFPKLLARGRSHSKAADFKYGCIFGTLIKGIRRNRRDPTQEPNQIIEAANEALELEARFEELKNMTQEERMKTPVWQALPLMMQMRLWLIPHLVFTAHRQLLIAQFRKGDFQAAIRTGTVLVQAATFCREPRLAADGLLLLCTAYWCDYALEIHSSNSGESQPTSDAGPSGKSPANWSFSEAQLRQIRDLLYKVDSNLTHVASDKSTLQGQYLMLLGIYNVEKALTESIDNGKGSDQSISGRGEYGEDLFTTGQAMINELQERGLKNLLMADVYLRHYIAIGKKPSDWSSEWPHATGPIAQSYFMRSLHNLINDPPSEAPPSNDSTSETAPSEYPTSSNSPTEVFPGKDGKWPLQMAIPIARLFHTFVANVDLTTLESAEKIYRAMAQYPPQSDGLVTTLRRLILPQP